MNDNERKSNFFVAILDRLEKCSGETLLFLFFIALMKTIIAIVCVCVLFGENSPPEPKVSPLMESLRNELRVSSDHDYCKIVMEHLMELEQRENQRNQVIVFNVPASIANVSSQDK